MDEAAVERRNWRMATYVLIAIWIAFQVRLMIADVWDETNGMLAFSSPSMSLAQKLQFVLTQSLGFWRPLPTLFVATLLHFVRDFDVSWRVLRGVNMVMLIGAVMLLSRASWRTGNPACPVSPSSVPPPSARRGDRQECLSSTILVAAILYSASGVIAAGWYANVFDVSALLLIAFGLSLLLQGRDIAAGVVLGLAFFCKETAALALPFLLVLFAAKRITFKQAARSGSIAAIFGAVYFAIRSRIVPFGSSGDIHGFDPGLFVPTLVNLAESFWEQTLKAPGLIGFAFFALSLAALRRPRLIAATLVFFAATAVIYWGMFGEYQNGVLIHHLNFVGRLYLVPAALLLFLLALERRTLAMALLLVPIVFGGAITWRDHARFQRMYKRIYRDARQAATKPLTVHFPAKPLDDTVRGIRIGDIPNAMRTVEPTTGRVR